MNKSTKSTDLHGACVNGKKTIPALVLCLLVTGAVHADQDQGIKFSGSGFLTLAAGKVLSGSGGDPAAVREKYGYQSPSFIADYAQGGVYESNGWNFGPDSKLGLQGEAKFNDRFSATGQVVARGARDGKVNLEWVYGSYKLDDKITLQAGRKRLPLFYYSESQDVGLSSPWVHLPPQLYGWEIVNYNGANVLYRDQWNGWASSLNVFAGNETRKDDGYWKIYNGKNSVTDSRWSDIVGGEWSLSPRDWLETRLVYIQSYTQNKVVIGNAAAGINPNADFSAKTRQKIYGFSVSADYESWVVRAEFLSINRREDYGGDRAQLLGVGYRVGKFLPMVTYANYKQIRKPDSPNVVNGTYPIDGAEGHDTLSLSLRYDLTTSSAVKAQFDHWRDKSGLGFTPPYGSSNLLTVGYDLVF